MIDLHTHTLFSDGVLLPSELIRRAYYAGYKALAITDHVDSSNIDFVVTRVAAAIDSCADYTDMKLIPGVEITHMPPKLIKKLVSRARDLGAKLVVVHGETVVEPVIPGTNSAAIDSGADILSHPGLITPEDAVRARENGVALEITSRKGHSLSNGHVAGVAVESGADLIISTDAHSPEDLISHDFAETVLRSAGLGEADIKKVFVNLQKIVDKLCN
jgi:histidinol phosphatase-like PHP family hydrolase